MKKILLATTILGMSAGVAAADISWSASAAAGVAQSRTYDDDSNDHYRFSDVYSQFKLGVKGFAETDAGITFSAAMDLTAGTKFNRGGDLGDGFEDKSGSFGEPTIAVSGEFGTVTLSHDNIDFYDDENTGDIQYTGEFGGVSVGVITEVATGNQNGHSSYQLGYTFAGVALTYSNDTYNIMNASASYTMGPVTGTLSTRYNRDENQDQISSLKLAYSADGISGSIKASDDDSQSVTLGYTANGITVSAESDSDEYSKVTGSYDLGGGLSIEAGTDSNQEAYLGAAMKF